MKKHFLLGLLGFILILFISFLYNTSAQDIRNIDIQEKMSFLKTVVYRPFLNPSADTQEEMLLPEAVEAGGFQMEEFNINISTCVPDTFLTIKEIEAIQKDIMQILNVDKKVIVIDMDSMRDSYYPPYQNYFEDISDIGEETILEQRTEDEGYNEIITFVPSEDGNMTTIKLLSTQIVEQPETHIMVDIVKNKGYKEIVDTSNQIQNLLNKHQNRVETTINLTGAQSGKLDKAREKQSQTAILSFLKAKKTEVLEDESFTSITAYSPLISSHIHYGGRDVNIQLAMRYSEYEDKTYLWLATPLITTAY
ncbi:MAG TPA: YwmB family TATA-box binding protein [Clostridia bacterium]|nr:YwmB family TATA-box binding protein [Clostridia bacterium]